MNYVMWWQPCDGQLSIYMCVMDDCRISNVLIYLICLCLSLLVMMNAFCMAMYCFKFLLWNLGHHIYLLCEITCHIASLFTSIYLFTHTCCTPWITKFRGSFCLGVCKACIHESNWNSNSCIHQGGALHKFWGSKSFKFFHSYKSLSWLSSITKKGEIESAFAPYVGFGVLMTSKLGTNVILMRYVAAISPMKDSKSW